jgi:plastocyanin
VINSAAKLLFAVCVAAGLLTIGYGIAVGDRGGALLFASAFFVALMAGLSLVATLGPDDALIGVGVDSEEAEAAEPWRTSVPAPSPWPLIAALAVATVAVGFAVDASLVGAGLLIGLVAFAGWLAQAWREYPGWSTRLSERMDDRLVLPAGLPVAAFVVVALIAVSISRVLLAVPKDPAVVVALVVAVVILFVCSLLAATKLTPGAIAGLAVVAALLTGGAGVVGAAAGEREFHPHEHPEHVTVVARNTQFDVDEITAEAGKARLIEFHNRDDVLHNIAVYAGEGEDSPPLFNGRPVTEGETEYEVEIEEPGDYRFVCDFHPNMTGAYIVE